MAGRPWILVSSASKTWHPSSMRAEIGPSARAAEPVVEMLFVGAADDVGPEELDRRLFVIRKSASRELRSSQLSEALLFYVCSLSTKILIYKGMLLIDQLGEFFPDLHDPHMVTAFGLVHSRFSTNTLGSWRLAHPYRMLCHNGEINTIRGNQTQRG